MGRFSDKQKKYVLKEIVEEIDGKLEQGQDIEYWKVMGRTKIMRIKTS